MTTNMPRAFAQESEENFNLTQLFASYVSKPEITALSPSFLTKGSKNVLVDYAQRVISRNGYTLYNQVNTGAGGVKSSYEWETSSGPQYSLRAYDHTLQFDWNGAYNTLYSNLRSPVMEFAKVLDYSEQQDVLLMVLGESNMRRWSGGASKARSSTATRITKQGVLGPSHIGTVTITVATPGVFTLVAHGLAVNDPIQISGGTIPTGLVAGTTYYVIAAGLTADNFEVSASVGGAAINTTGSSSGTISLFKSTNAVGIAFVAGDGSTVAPTITDTNNNFVAAGFAAGDTLSVVGSTANSKNFTIGSVTAGVITLIMSDVLTAEAAGPAITLYNQTGPTWKSARFFSTISGRALLYNGTSYTYAGGENTDTLIGLTAFPTVTAGDAVWQTPDTIALPSGITTPFPNFYPDLIAVQLNMVFLASTQSQMVMASKSIDYTNFALTTPRAPGDPVQQPLTSGKATCIIPIDTASDILNITNTLIFGSGIDAFDQMDFQMSQDNTQELLRIVRYKTAKGAGVISKGAICPIKNNTIYISNEPALDGLSRSDLEAPDGRRNVPISDPIKDDFDTYDFTNCHVIYHKRTIYIALPALGVVLMYDMMRNLWQPPQTIPVSRFAVISDDLYGHSAITNETYKLFVGTNDNGDLISQKARFAYNNGGTRDRIKNMTEHWTDGYITPNGVLNMNVYFGFSGSKGVRSKTILGTDPNVTVSNDASPLGDEVLGNVPLGGAPFNTVAGLPGAGIQLVRMYQIDTFAPVDYTEHFVEYTMEVLDGQFAIVAHGSNQWDAGTVLITNKK